MFSTLVSSTDSDTEVWISMVMSKNSRIQVVLNQENDLELDDKWLTANEWLTSFRRDRELVVVRFKVSEFPSVKGPQYYEEDLVVRERVPSRTEMPSSNEPGIYGDHIPIGPERNVNSSEHKERPVSMNNICYEVNDE